MVGRGWQEDRRGSTAKRGRARRGTDRVSPRGRPDSEGGSVGKKKNKTSRGGSKRGKFKGGKTKRGQGHRTRGANKRRIKHGL